MPMNLITKRLMIQSIPIRFMRQYEHYSTSKPRWNTKYATYTELFTALNSLDLETCTEEDVAGIIGNDTWTRLICDNCCARVEEVVQLGQPQDYESSTANICRACAHDALKLFLEEDIKNETG